MYKNVTISLLIWLLIFAPAILLSVPAVALLLLSPWDGRSTIFGNRKWGRATAHPDHATKSYWQEFNWLVLRNPVNNLAASYLAAKFKPEYTLMGEQTIGDKIAGGFYVIKMGIFWEYYWIRPYSLFGKRCIRARIGWKILNSDRPCPYVFAINPWKKYSGVW